MELTVNQLVSLIVNSINEGALTGEEKLGIFIHDENVLPVKKEDFQIVQTEEEGKFLCINYDRVYKENIILVDSDGNKVE